jgi:hypothetical protein
VVLTGDGIGRDAFEGFLAVLVETIDPADRAHLVRQRLYKDHGPFTPHNSMLAEPGVIMARYDRPPGRLRRYHPSQVTSRGMPYDSMFDGAALTATRLQHTLNIDLGWRTCFPRSPKTEQIGANEYDRERMFRGLKSEQIRDIIRPRTRQRMTPAEKKLDRQAAALLAEHTPQTRFPTFRDETGYL